MRTAGLLLVLGLVCGLVAAMMPTLGPVWNARPHEQLALIGTRVTAWTISTLLFAAGLVAAMLGVAVLGHHLLAPGGGAAVWVAVATFVAGTTLWLIHLGFRLTVVVSTARDVAAGDPAPGWYVPLWQWGNSLLAAYVLLASIGLIALGAAILSTGALPGWTGWTTIGMGAVFIAALAAMRNTMPVLPHLASGLVGVVALVDAAGRG
jgi:hypothetical protein